MMYTRTDRLTVIERNFSALDDFRMPPDVINDQRLTVNISRFLENHGQFLGMETQFGNLEIYSDFFFGDVGLNEQQHNSSLRFSFYEGERGSPIILLEILRQDEIDRYLIDGTSPRPINIERPGKSSILRIPLDSDFMRGSRGELLYNAVEFLCHDGCRDCPHGVLPRSFICDDYLHVFFNRTGQFQLIRTPHGSTSNRADFLRDRGIELHGIHYRGQIVVMRGAMYAALMNIHSAESMFFDISSVERFPDVFGAMEVPLHIGRALGVIGAHTDGTFRPDDPLQRRELFAILANQIDVFGYEVEGLMPPRPGMLGMPSEENGTWWERHINDLIDIRFVPYRRVLIPATNYEPERYVFDLAPREYVTIEEAHEILFRLITLDIIEPISDPPLFLPGTQGQAQHIGFGTVQFGNHDWRILDVQGNYALIITENAIEQRRYNPTQVAVSWATSEMRQHLNGTFLEGFSEYERGRIRETAIDGETNDRVFLLSWNEVVRYFGDNRHDRIARNANGTDVWWWLRMPGISGSYGDRVSADGTLRSPGHPINYIGGVRPAMWIRL